MITAFNKFEFYSILIVSFLSLYAIFTGALHHIGTLVLCIILMTIHKYSLKNAKR